MNDRYICPDHVNPAEFLADLISIDYGSAETVYASRKRIDGLVESFSQKIATTMYASPIYSNDLKNLVNSKKKTVIKRKGGWWRQFFLLLKRAWMQACPYHLSIFSHYTDVIGIWDS